MAKSLADLDTLRLRSGNVGGNRSLNGVEGGFTDWAEQISP